MALSGNKGEWSEIYALLKLLSDGKLYVGDANLNRIENLFYPILQIIRNESGNNYEYDLTGDLVFINGENSRFSVPILTFKKNASIVLDNIKKAKGTFRIKELEEFLTKINCVNLTAKSTKKTDIVVVIHDIKLNQKAELGFSVKSQLGSESTLLNAGRTTNFVFEILNCNLSKKEISEINSINSRSKVKDRLNTIKQKGGKIKFQNLENSVFQNNLILIDSLLPNMLSEIVLTFYTSSLNSVNNLIEDIDSRNTLKYDKQHQHSFYKYKMKKFLTEAALGMMPSKVWSGEYDATGGYLVIKEDGEILCYHVYNRNRFEDYLFHNTKLETASTTKHGFGVVYKVGEKLFINLNLQIRFK